MRLVPSIVLLCAALLASSGCKATINAPDVFAPAGESVEIVAHVERKWFIFTTPLGERNVRFLSDGREVGQAVTDKDGRAAITIPINASGHGQMFVAQTQFGRQPAADQLLVYGWDRDRTIVAVDIDGTISDTDYSTLLFDRIDNESVPIPGSRETLRHLADDYQILYVTARPRVLATKTREWLNKYEFPDGPLVCGPDSRAMLSQSEFKVRLIAELRATWPNLLIGIGDKSPDRAGYGRNGMLTLLISDKASRPKSHAVRLPDWSAVGCYFDAYRELLSQPAALSDYLEVYGPPHLYGVAYGRSPGAHP